MSAYTPEQAAQVRWPARWAKYRIPLRFQGLGLADYQPTDANGNALALAHNLVNTWPTRRPRQDDLPDDRSLIGKGGIFVGSYGSGKTRLVCAIGTDIARRYNTTILYVSVSHFFHLGKSSPEEAGQLKRAVERVPLLIWDDQGTEYDSGSGYVGSEVYRIFRLRFDRGLPILATTNLPLDRWSEKYEGSMFSFLHEAFDAAVLGGRDWRRAAR